MFAKKESSETVSLLDDDELEKVTGGELVDKCPRTNSYAGPGSREGGKNGCIFNADGNCPSHCSGMYANGNFTGK